MDQIWVTILFGVTTLFMGVITVMAQMRTNRDAADRKTSQEEITALRKRMGKFDREYATRVEMHDEIKMQIDMHLKLILTRFEHVNQVLQEIKEKVG